MTLEPKIRVTIGDFVFDYIHDLEIDSSYENLTTTAILQMPRRIFLRKKDNSVESVKQVDLNKLIKRFDKIKIEFGYKEVKEILFEGIVTKVGTDVPVMIECEDIMFLLKQTKIKDKSFEKVGLKDLIDYVKSNFANSEFEDVKKLKVNVITEISNLGSYRLLNGTTVSELLSKLKQSNGVVSFVKNGILTIGRPEKSNQVSAKFRYGFNVISQNRLEYWEEKEINVKMDLVAIDSEGNQLRTTIGAKDGQTITQFVYGKFTEKELKEQGQQILERFRYTGYRGEFEAFLLPIVRPGDAVEYSDKINEKPSGLYIAKAVRYRFGLNGFRQFITIGDKQ